MPTNAHLFEYEPFRHFCISIARSSYLVYNLRLSQTTKKTAEKKESNAQWFHCSWSILLKRVNIRVRGFHLVFLKLEEAARKTIILEAFSVKFGRSLAQNDPFGSFFCEIWRKPRTKRFGSFWCFCGGVFVVVFVLSVFLFFCGGVFVVLW